MKFIKTILFHILLSLRGMILVACKLLSFVFIGSFIMATIFEIQTIPSSAKVMMVLCGIMSTSIYWFYDYIIFYLKPKTIDIMLIKR